MDYIPLSYFAVLLVVFYIYKKIYAFYTNKEKKKSSTILVSFFSALGLALVIYNLLIRSDFEIEGYEIFLTIVITLIMWTSAYLFENRDRSSIFRAVKIEGNSIAAAIGQYEFKRVSNFNSKQIPFYVRFTIYELIEKNENMVFDSSDYSVINKAFGAYENFQQSFIKGGEFEFKNKLYSTEFVKIDLVSIIDDYHMGHSNIYEGLDTPYNIQVIVKLKEITNAFK